MSFAYQKAANVIQDFWSKKASLKTLVYGSDFPKKGYLFALCNKTLLAEPLLDEIVDNCPSLEPNAVSKKALFYVTLYDEIFGEGCRGGGALVRSVRNAKEEILAFLNAKKEKMGVDSIHDLIPKESSEEWRFVRVNRCKTTVDKVVRILSEECGADNVHRDDLIDCVLRVPRSVDLHAHPLVLSQSIVLQTKASCFPPFLLLNDLYDGTKKLPSRCDVIDATAAPGNKTTFLGDILRSQGTVFAFDRDDYRFSVLRGRCKEYGSQNITCIHADFLKTNPFAAQFANVQRIQLDPSCSGSGMSHTALDAREPTQERLEALTQFQLHCILHAARFPAVTRISYSTCSVYEEEDEKVVAEALRELNQDGAEWSLEHVTDALPRRGHVVDGLSEEQAKCVVRCENGDGVGQGFFVCVFVREKGMELTPAERKKKEKEFKKEMEVPVNEGEIAPSKPKKVILPKKVTKGKVTLSKVTPAKKGKAGGSNLKGKALRTNPKEKVGGVNTKEKKDKAPADYAARSRMVHPGKHSKRIPLGKSCWTVF